MSKYYLQIKKVIIRIFQKSRRTKTPVRRAQLQSSLAYWQNHNCVCEGSCPKCKGSEELLPAHGISSPGELIIEAGHQPADTLRQQGASNLHPSAKSVEEEPQVEMHRSSINSGKKNRAAAGTNQNFIINKQPASVPQQPVQQNSAKSKATAPGSSNAQTIYSPIHYTTYLITAETLHQAVAVMNPDEAGVTKWRTRFEPEVDSNNIVTKVKVYVNIKVTLPRWPGAQNLPKAQKDEWDRFYLALQKHEDQHAAIVKGEMANVASQLLGKSNADALIYFQDKEIKLQNANDAFDKRTDHGKNQGTVIDLSK